MVLIPYLVRLTYNMAHIFVLELEFLPFLVMTHKTLFIPKIVIIP